GDNTELKYLAERLSDLRSPGNRNWCWGYSFPWQNRVVLVPRGTPNLVCTCFAANALLDLFEHLNDEKHLSMAISSADYILKELYYMEKGGVASFHYPLAGDRSKVHNANLLAAALLWRVARLAGEDRFIEPANKAA